MVTDKLENEKQIKAMEEANWDRIRNSSHALSHHLMPPIGWLNDPNGLCQKNDIHHIFFQYSPFDANGADKYWGHYETTDLIHYTYTGVLLSPDTPLDADGVYSGSALVEPDMIYLYYTGNVLEPGDHDYISSGRGSNTTMVHTKDGQSFDSKTCLLSSADYPNRLSCHVRDPKVWKENGIYYMVLGARTKEDKGCVLVYRSMNPTDFSFQAFLETKEPFGYMWECPDLFTLDGKRFLSFSPQGVPAQEFRYQNAHQSGYLPLPDSSFFDDLLNTKDKDGILTVGSNDFLEWDYGFDFYAPQTYLDNLNRRILIGWIGLPDAPYTNPTIQDGWQHALTLPRELVYDKSSNRIFSRPVRELEQLRSHTLSVINQQIESPESCELMITNPSSANAQITLDYGLLLSYEKEAGSITLSFSQPDQIPLDHRKDSAMGYGRDARKLKLNSDETFEKAQIFLDRSVCEIYINDGAYVFTTRFYKQNGKPGHVASFSKNLCVTAYTLLPLDIQKGAKIC